MEMTQGLKARLTEKHGLAANATPEQAKALAISELAEGRLSAKDLAELSSSNPNDRFTQLLEKSMDKAVAARLGTASNPAPVAAANPGENEAAKAFEGMNAAEPNLRVKKASERYTSTKSRMKWMPNANERLTLMGKSATAGTDREAGMDAYVEEVNPFTGTVTKRYMDELSEAEKAKCGAVFKHQAYRAIGPELYVHCPWMKMTEEDRELVKEAAHEDSWVGPVTKSMEIEVGRKLSDFETKAVLGDTGGASGGEQAIPQYFDYEAIRTPLLFGELFPYVQLVVTDRGKAAHSYSIGTPTFVSTASGTAITPFDTTGFVAAFDVPFFPASCGFEWGRDFEADSAPQFAGLVMAQMGDSFKKLLDDWIANGDGTTQPQGLKNASGIATVAATGTSHAAMVYNDALNLQFGINKAHRKAFGGSGTRMVMNDSQYKRLMQIVTGVTGDTRPIFGMHVKDYQIGDYPVSVQDDIINGTMYFANLRGYRMYQRKGLEFQLVDTGRTLTLSNLKLLFARARFGGKLTLAGYAAKMINAGIP